MERLYELIGMESPKEQINKQIARSAIQAKASKLGVQTEDFCNHMAFLGNPGSGKTELARCLADIYFGLEITKTPEFTEVRRENLVQQYIGHTEAATKKILDKVIKTGGILFIDEFHQLAEKGDTGNDFGLKAIQTLVPYLENNRRDFVCIVAGYPDKMRYTLTLDEGLAGRFSTFIEFPDYSVDELIKIFIFFCKKNHRYLTDTATILEKGDCHKILDGIENQQILNTLKTGLNNLIREFENIGNARAMRKLFEKAEIHQALRMYNSCYKNGALTICDRDFLKKYSFFEIEDIEAALAQLKEELEQIEGKKSIRIGF